MEDSKLNAEVAKTFGYVSSDIPDFVFEDDLAIVPSVARHYADDPLKQGEFLKHLRATREDMTTFNLLTLDARDWCVAFLKTEGKWKEG